jgi:tRNA(fMet)-specific endonuclease VapC
MKYLIDTDWVIDHLNGAQEVIRKLEEIAPQGLALSIISLAELYEGIYFSSDSAEDEKSLQKFLEGVTILEINEEICKAFARERGRLRKNGGLIGDFDLLIASTCLHYNLTLLTGNIKHFERVESLRILSKA